MRPCMVSPPCSCCPPSQPLISCRAVQPGLAAPPAVVSSHASCLQLSPSCPSLPSPFPLQSRSLALLAAVSPDSGGKAAGAQRLQLPPSVIHEALAYPSAKTVSAREHNTAPCLCIYLFTHTSVFICVFVCARVYACVCVWCVCEAGMDQCVCVCLCMCEWDI